MTTVNALFVAQPYEENENEHGRHGPDGQNKVQLLLSIKQYYIPDCSMQPIPWKS